MGRRQRRPRAPEIQPVDVDGVQAVGIGTLIWTIAFVVLLFFRSELQASGRESWLWTSLAGAGLGLLGLEYCRRRRDRLREERRRQAAAGVGTPERSRPLATPATPTAVGTAGQTEPTEPAAIPTPRSRPGRRRASSR